MPRRTSITLKLVSAFLLPTVILFVVFSFLVYRFAQRDLADSLGRRLIGIAASAATQLRGDYLDELVEGDEDDVRYQSALRKLKSVQQETGVSRIYVVDANFETKVDSASDFIGAKNYQAEIERLEIARMLGDAEPFASLLFEGHQRHLEKAGYAPVFENRSSRRPLLVLGVDAPADFFGQLRKLEQRLWSYGVVLALSVIAIALWFASRLTRPLRELAQSADEIGKGHLDVSIPSATHDEIGVLASTMERMRNDLKARDERMRMMVAGIAHEVRNPLGGMELYAGILKEELGNDDEKQGHLAKIQRELIHLKTVVENFLDYARRPKLNVSSTDVSVLVNESLDVLRPMASERHVSLNSELNSLILSLDTELFRSVVLNLVQNAVQAASGDSPSVLVNVDAGSGGRLSVHNSGDAIDKEVLERMFEPFFTTREKGTGLGLAFAKDIIEAHGARLRVETKDGFGTVFSVEFSKEVE